MPIQRALLVMFMASVMSFHMPRIVLKLSNTQRYSTTALLESRKVGSFIRNLPQVHPADVHYNKAVKVLKRVKLDSNIKNLKNAHCKLAAQSMDELMKSLTVPLTQLLAVHRQANKQHPYEVTCY
jgi:hypothetical protein